MGKKKSKTSNLEANLVAFLVFCFFAGAIGLLVVLNPATPKQRAEIKRERAEAKAEAESTWRGNLDAEYAGRFAVEKHLLAPSTAKFHGLPMVQEQRDGVVVVTGTVDTENAYGTMTRKAWRVEIEPMKKGREWVPNFLLVQVGDQVVHTGQREAQRARTMPHEEPAAETLMIASLPSPNQYRIVYTDFASLTNPHGEGAIVFIPNKTRFNGVKRTLAWFVIDEKAYNLNGAAASLTPDLPWPREEDPSVWARTGLDSTGSQALRLAFP